MSGSIEGRTGGITAESLSVITVACLGMARLCSLLRSCSSISCISEELASACERLREALEQDDVCCLTTLCCEEVVQEPGSLQCLGHRNHLRPQQQVQLLTGDAFLQWKHLCLTSKSLYWKSLQVLGSTLRHKAHWSNPVSPTRTPMPSWGMAGQEQCLVWTQQSSKAVEAQPA